MCFLHFLCTFARKVFKGLGWNFTWKFGKVNKGGKFSEDCVITCIERHQIMHNVCVRFMFSTFSIKILIQPSWNFTWLFVMIMSIWMCKMVSLACMINIIRHIFCITCAFFIFFVKKSFFSEVKHFFHEFFWPDIFLQFLSKILLLLPKDHFWPKNVLPKYHFDQRMFLPKK